LATALDPHDGLPLDALLPNPTAKPSSKASTNNSKRICVRAIGLGYGKDARLAQAWAEHCRRRPEQGPAASAAAAAAATDASDCPQGAPADGRLHPQLLKSLQEGRAAQATAAATATTTAFIRPEPEVTAHTLSGTAGGGGDAAVVLASAALRAVLPPAEIVLLAHGFDARRLSALRLAYTKGKAAVSGGGGGGAAWAAVDDCGAASLAGAAAASSTKLPSGLDQMAGLALLSGPTPAPRVPQGEPNAARVLVHVARARAVDGANREAVSGGGGATAPPRLATGGRALPKALAKHAATHELDAADATRLDLAVDPEALAATLDSQRRRRRLVAAAARKKGRPTASFDDGTDFSAEKNRVLVLPEGYGSLPGFASQEEVEEEQQQQQQHASTGAAPLPAIVTTTKRDVHGDLAAVVLALEWGGGTAATSSSTTATALAAAARSSRPGALYRWELVRRAVKARCARRRQLRASWYAAADALRRAADAAARDAEVAAWRVLGEAVHVTRAGEVLASQAAPAAAAAGGAAGARAVVMLGMGGSAKGPAAAQAGFGSSGNTHAHSLRRHRGPSTAARHPSPVRSSASPRPPVLRERSC
jgi:hypothetical protein